MFHMFAVGSGILLPSLPRQEHPKLIDSPCFLCLLFQDRHISASSADLKLPWVS